MKIYEKHLGENYYLFAVCDTEYFSQVSTYIEHVSSIQNTMVNVFGLKPYFRRYYVLFSDRTHNGEEYIGAYYLPEGLILIKPDDTVIRGDPDFLWGGVVHEVFHAFLEPLKWFPGGQLNYQYHNFIEGVENNHEGFNLIMQKQLYSSLNKQELVERLLKEQAGNNFFILLDNLIQEKGFEIAQNLFRRINKGEHFDKNLWSTDKTNKEILTRFLLTS